MRVVLDTNIIVSGLAYAGNERRVIELARGAQFELFLSTHILRELEGVMPRKFDWPSERVSRNINNLRSIATIIESPPPSSSEQITNHAEDDRILDCVAAAEADFLVTGGQAAFAAFARIWECPYRHCGGFSGSAGGSGLLTAPLTFRPYCCQHVEAQRIGEAHCHGTS